jgi:ubiquinone biosynthesis protein COQ9
MQVGEEMAAVLEALPGHAAFDGWNVTALGRALADVGQAPEDAAVLFPGGAGEMVEAFFALSFARMEAAAAQADLAAYRTPGRVRAVIAIWFEQNAGNKEAVRRALSWLSLPGNLRRGVRINAGMADAVWHAAGDTSADFNWYTKRGLLAAVFAATLLYWVHDRSGDEEAVLWFLDRRLADVAWIGGLRKRVAGRLQGRRFGVG